MNRKEYQNDKYCLGINLIGHDCSISLVNLKGEPVIVMEEERYRRIKRGEFIMSPSILTQLWNETLILPEQIKILASSNIHSLRELRTYVSRDNAPWHGFDRLSSQMLRYYVSQLSEIESIIQVRHHMAHAASAYYPSGFNRSAILTIDGKGETESATICIGNKGSINKVKSIKLPSSIGYLYTRIATWAGLRGVEREGKLMALSSYGSNKMIKKIEESFFSSTKGSQFLMSENLLNRPSTRKQWDDYCKKVLGKPRKPDGPITERECDVAKSLQSIVEKIVMSLVKEAHAISESKNLCLAGGVFMNSIVNGMIAKKSLFKNVYVPPWPNDVGLSIGSALYAVSNIKSIQPKKRWKGAAYLGSEFDDNSIEMSLKDNKLPIHKVKGDIAEITAELINQGLIVGWFQGRMEVGPRALGARSIIALPYKKEISDYINQHIKFRENWRPFAPAVLAEEMNQIFGFQFDSPYMSFVFPVKKFEQNSLAATLSVDLTARVQVVTSEENPIFHRLLINLHKLNKVGAVLNTSFNVQGEPIVRTPNEAINNFINTNLDALVIGNYLVLKKWLPECKQIHTFHKIKYPCIISSMIKSHIHNKSCKFLWMDRLIYKTQEKTLKQLCHKIDSQKLPTWWILEPENAKKWINELLMEYQIIVFGINTYIPFALNHLSKIFNIFGSIIIHKKDIMNKIFLIDKDINLILFKELMNHPCNLDILDPNSELEYIWKNFRKEE